MLIEGSSIQAVGAGLAIPAGTRVLDLGDVTLLRGWALLEAVFRDGVAQLCARAAAQTGEDPAAELVAWLEEVTVYTATNRGLAAALLAGPDGLTLEELCCADMLLDVSNGLVTRASSVGAIHSGATTEDLMMLANAIAIEDDPLTARRVLRLALAGIRS
ncbi:TetR/AcrR family transcriptional regulator [Corallococcus sp. EGB]|uniref:SbtR family transcriptional regulator n=1 Tax=Corallococcus sp. EGB TaxID=1521117 RepID=UPI001CBF1350|nr:TetR/AcrR family transcriptional regulator [Corallococcus sp. EGB]